MDNPETLGNRLKQLTYLWVDTILQNLWFLSGFPW